MAVQDTVAEFVKAINAHHLEKIVSAMTPDHAFTDSLGKLISGRRHMRDAWQGYLKAIPDYQVKINETFVADQVVVVVGEASGTYAPDGEVCPGQSWRVPAAWRAKVVDGRIAEWQAYLDNQGLRRAMAADK